MKLIEMLYVNEFEWPDSVGAVGQNSDCEVLCLVGKTMICNGCLLNLADDWENAAITREEYEAYCKQRDFEKRVPTLKIDNQTSVLVKVWDDDGAMELNAQLLATFPDGACIARSVEDGDIYHWQNYEIIEQSSAPKQTHRPFKGYAEFKQHLVDSGRTNLFIENVYGDDRFISSLGVSDENDWEHTFECCTWLDTGEPVGMPL